MPMVEGVAVLSHGKLTVQLHAHRALLTRPTSQLAGALPEFPVDWGVPFNGLGMKQTCPSFRTTSTTPARGEELCM